MPFLKHPHVLLNLEGFANFIQSFEKEVINFQFLVLRLLKIEFKQDIDGVVKLIIGFGGALALDSIISLAHFVSQLEQAIDIS